MLNHLTLAVEASTAAPTEWATQAAKTLKDLHVESVLLPLLWQIALIIIVARIFSILFRQMGQPGTVGEIAAGLIIGPSVLGKLAPDLFNSIFHPAMEGVPLVLSDQLFRWILTSFSQFGLILLLFLIGMEFDFKHLKVSGKAALAVSVTGVVFPFGLGLLVALILYPVVGQGIDQLGFTLFLGTSMSITAIPILGRIMMELGITRSRIGALTISAAAVDGLDPLGHGCGNGEVGEIGKWRNRLGPDGHDAR
jgi:Kef-type K+ transport system membrane component KefB